MDAVLLLTDQSTYSNSSTCVTVLVSPDGTPVRLTFTAFNIELSYDFLYVSAPGRARSPRQVVAVPAWHTSRL